MDKDNRNLLSFIEEVLKVDLECWQKEMILGMSNIHKIDRGVLHKRKVRKLRVLKIYVDEFFNLSTTDAAKYIMERLKGSGFNLDDHIEYMDSLEDMSRVYKQYYYEEDEKNGNSDE